MGRKWGAKQVNSQRTMRAARLRGRGINPALDQRAAARPFGNPA